MIDEDDQVKIENKTDIVKDYDLYMVKGKGDIEIKPGAGHENGGGVPDGPAVAKFDDKGSSGENDDDTSPPTPLRGAMPGIMAGAADYFGLGLISPLLPYWLEDKGEPETYVGYIQTAQYLGVIVGSIVLGRLCDLYGRKPTMLLALSGDVVFFMSTGFCPNANWLMVNRFVAGMFTPLVISIAWVNDVGRGDLKATGKMMSAWAVCMSTSFMAGGLVGGALGSERWVFGHALCSFMALVAFIYITHIPEPPRADAQVKPEGLDRVLKSREYRAICGVQFMVGLTFTGTIVISTLITAVILELSSLETACVFASVALFHLLENLVLMPMVINRFGNSLPAMDVSVVTSAVFYALLSFEFAYESVFLSTFFVVCASSIVPVIMTSNNIIAASYATRYSKNAKGTALGISRLCFNVGQMLGPVVAVVLYDVDVRVFFVTFIGLTLISYCPWRYLHHVTSIEYERNQTKVFVDNVEP